MTPEPPPPRRPTRVQRRRAKGWRAPLCSCGCGRRAVYVGRGTPWGNPYQVSHYKGEWLVFDLADASRPTLALPSRLEAMEAAKRLFADELTASTLHCSAGVPELASHDLMCWCPPGTHAAPIRSPGPSTSQDDGEGQR